MSDIESRAYAWSVIGDGGQEVPLWLCPDGYARMVLAKPPKEGFGGSGVIELVLTKPVPVFPPREDADE